ncbi:MAG: hypothetical protein IE878_06220 [Epsilonproteobacteria bacterium]|nr:hypothetical protein [Campylobacterota bacterium]
MNARTESFIGLASSNELRIALHYEDAAKILYDSKAYQDGLALPFLFLVRQFVELGLKYNIKKLNEVSTCDNLITALNGTHNLTKIHSAFLAHLDRLEKLINKLVLLDFDSQGFRYSTDKDDNKIIEQKETFNLKEVFDLLDDTSTLLSSIEDLFGLTQAESNA